MHKRFVSEKPHWIGTGIGIGIRKRNRGGRKAGGRAGVLFVGEGADDGAEEHGGSEAGDEEAADVALVEAVLAVEVVHVGALQPVPGCTNPSHAITSHSRQGQQATIRTATAFADLNKGRTERGGVHIMRE